ncbi:response regulator [Streptomyces sp. NPDC003393]
MFSDHRKIALGCRDALERVLDFLDPSAAFATGGSRSTPGEVVMCGVHQKRGVFLGDECGNGLCHPFRTDPLLRAGLGQARQRGGLLGKGRLSSLPAFEDLPLSSEFMAARVRAEAEDSVFHLIGRSEQFFGPLRQPLGSAQADDRVEQDGEGRADQDQEEPTGDDHAAHEAAVCAGSPGAEGEQTHGFLPVGETGDVRALDGVPIGGGPTTMVGMTPGSPTSRAGEEPAVPHLRIVLAEDDVRLREGLASLLQGVGCTVAGRACDARQLLDVVRRMRPELVLTDIRMPPGQGTEGLDPALTIQEELPDTGTLVLSAYARNLCAASWRS